LEKVDFVKPMPFGGGPRLKKINKKVLIRRQLFPSGLTFNLHIFFRLEMILSMYVEQICEQVVEMNVNDIISPPGFSTKAQIDEKSKSDDSASSDEEVPEEAPEEVEVYMLPAELRIRDLRDA
jgi:hypothetical protein